MLSIVVLQDYIVAHNHFIGTRVTPMVHPAMILASKCIMAHDLTQHGAGSNLQSYMIGWNWFCLWLGKHIVTRPFLTLKTEVWKYLLYNQILRHIFYSWKPKYIFLTHLITLLIEHTTFIYLFFKVGPYILSALVPSI